MGWSTGVQDVGLWVQVSGCRNEQLRGACLRRLPTTSTSAPPAPLHCCWHRRGRRALLLPRSGRTPSTGSPARLCLQDKARDSFENLLFGLCRFYELTGHYPEFITVGGWVGGCPCGVVWCGVVWCGLASSRLACWPCLRGRGGWAVGRMGWGGRACGGRGPAKVKSVRCRHGLDELAGLHASCTPCPPSRRPPWQPACPACSLYVPPYRWWGTTSSSAASATCTARRFACRRRRLGTRARPPSTPRRYR